MKTFTQFAAALLIAILFSTNISAKGFEMEEEEYIDDIPFNTYKISQKHFINPCFTYAEIIK